MDVFVTHLIIIIKSEVSTFPIVVIFYVYIYIYMYIPGKLGCIFITVQSNDVRQ